MFSSEPEFVGVKPSLIAAASITSAITGMYPALGFSAQQVLSKLLKTGIPELQFTLNRLEKAVDQFSKEHHPVDPFIQDQDPLLPPSKQMSRQMQEDPNYICYSPLEQTSHNDSLEDNVSDNSNINSSDWEGYDTPSDINEVNLSDWHSAYAESL